ncbi:dTMP kinase [Campylobacter sp. B0100352/1]|uniref:dTMP kinase n=1 Tax=Campylobacter sp. B0100352/1 TaxID=2735783 RepID=UPI001DC9FE1A|nr:dTMP kinase [Campylobacter sp. B0100352/1]
MYVAFEGIDCVGKSTQISLLKEIYKEAIFTLEPGGTDLGKSLRDILLYQNLNLKKRAEVLLFLADRAQHYEEVIHPNKDKLIISDRSFISGMAYAVDFDNELLFSLNSFALDHFFPQKIIFLKADEKLIKQRLGEKKQDAIEQRGIEYFLNVQNKLENILFFLKNKIQIEILKLDANKSIEELHTKIKEFLQ